MVCGIYCYENYHERMEKIQGVKMEQKALEEKGWRYVATEKGVEIYTKRTPFSSQCPDIFVQHVGFSMGNQWDNYCFPADTEWYLEEHLDHFIAHCAIHENWDKMLKKVHESELPY